MSLSGLASALFQESSKESFSGLSSAFCKSLSNSPPKHRLRFVSCFWPANAEAGRSDLNVVVKVALWAINQGYVPKRSTPTQYLAALSVVAMG
jgi:hypothetical protein